MKLIIKVVALLILSQGLISCKKEPTEKYISKAEDLNKKLPVEFNRGIRMDSVKALSAQEFKYYYTLLKDPKVLKGSFIESSRPQILNSLKNSANSAALKEDGMTIIYAYYKTDGSLYAEIVVTPSEY